MEVIIAVASGLAFLLLMMMVGSRASALRSRGRTRSIIDDLASGESSDPSETVAQSEEDVVEAFKEQATGLSKFLISLPKAGDFYLLVLKAGYVSQIRSVVMLVLGLFAVFSLIFGQLVGFLGVLPAAVLAIIVPRWFLRRAVRKRNLMFIDMFPEAIDMIVRSVKSGHPLNTALRMIADNMDPPVGTEFRQVINEVSYGLPVVEALQRMSKRIDEPDVHFFVVVLAVQQETGGNLAEVLGNLSNVIRGRKRLNQKIMALTSEGRATAWVLGSLPFIQIGAVAFFSPDYLLPLIETVPGNIVFAAAACLIGLALFITSQMIKVDI